MANNTSNMVIIVGFIILIIIAVYLLFSQDSSPTPTPTPISNKSNTTQNKTGVTNNDTNIPTNHPQSLSNNVILDMVIKPIITPINRGSQNQYNVNLLNKDKDLIIYYDFMNITSNNILNMGNNPSLYNGQLMTKNTNNSSTFTNCNAI